LEERWGKKYEKVLESWRNNWSKLTTYFQYDTTIRKLIYTTKVSPAGQKSNQNQGGGTSDTALLKLIYLAHSNIKQKWTMPLSNWAATAQKLVI
jgi:transposase-like protein